MPRRKGLTKESLREINQGGEPGQKREKAEPAATLAPKDCDGATYERAQRNNEKGGDCLVEAREPIPSRALRRGGSSHDGICDEPRHEGKDPGGHAKDGLLPAGWAIREVGRGILWLRHLT